ncbi:unnamed protein product [Closterium sp. NIES-64]|nr:unnamed protein product [Closterium sp. NIES-64]
MIVTAIHFVLYCTTARQLFSRSYPPHPSPRQMREILFPRALRRIPLAREFVAMRPLSPFTESVSGRCSRSSLRSQAARSCAPVLQLRLTIARTASSPAHVDFEYSDTLCGTAWRDDYIRLHSAIRSASAAAYTPPPSPTPPPPASSPASHSSRRLLSLANSPPLPPPAAAAIVTSAAAAAATSAEVSEPSLSNQTLPASPIRFLTFDQAGHCGGFGDFLVGLVSSFVAALLDRRAFVIRQNCIQYAFEPAFIDWRPSPDVPMEPFRRTRNLNESFSPGVIPFLDLNGNRLGLQGLERFKAFRHVKVLWNRRMSLRCKEVQRRCPLEERVMAADDGGDAHGAGEVRKEVWPLTARLLQEMREVRTVVVGVHVRLSDSVVRDPHATAKSVTPASMAAALEAAAPILACAKVSEPSHAAYRLNTHLQCASPAVCVTCSVRHLQCASSAVCVICSVRTVLPSSPVPRDAPILACAEVSRPREERQANAGLCETKAGSGEGKAGSGEGKAGSGEGKAGSGSEDMWYPPPLTVRWMLIVSPSSPSSQTTPPFPTPTPPPPLPNPPCSPPGSGGHVVSPASHNALDAHHQLNRLKDGHPIALPRQGECL